MRTPVHLSFSIRIQYIVMFLLCEKTFYNVNLLKTYSLKKLTCLLNTFSTKIRFVKFMFHLSSYSSFLRNFKYPNANKTIFKIIYDDKKLKITRFN